MKYFALATVHTHGVHSNESGLFKVALRQEAGFWPHSCIGLWPCSTVHGPEVNSNLRCRPIIFCKPER